MKRLKTLTALVLAAELAAGCGAARAQKLMGEPFSQHNAEMTKLQPALITPLVEADPRLIQYVRASFSHEYTEARTATMNYGNGRGGGVIVADRFEFDFVPPAYIQHNVASAQDGLGDTSMLGKVRIASGNAQHGSFDVAALLNHCFATGTYKNGALTDSWEPIPSGDLMCRRRWAGRCRRARLPRRDGPLHGTR